MFNSRIVEENGKFLWQFETSDGWVTENICDTYEEAKETEEMNHDE